MSDKTQNPNPSWRCQYVAVPEYLLDTTQSTSKPQKLAVADLTNKAFHYLLRVGEYTNPRSNKILTVPFRVMDVTFRDSQGRLIPNHSDLETLLQAEEATIRITDQKNGIKGQCVHNQCTKSKYNPIKSLATRFQHILSHGRAPDTPIYYYKHPTYYLWRKVKADDITQAVKQAAAAVGLYNLGYSQEGVSSHSLRTGGVMAMHINGVDAITIRKMGRWKLDTFLM